MSKNIEIDTLTNWNKSLETDPTHKLASVVLKNYNADDVLIDKSVYSQHEQHLFNHVVEVEGTPVTSQKASGRCWLFAATNELRLPLIKEYKLKDFELSQSYLFFYDKLEKANYFLDQIIQTANEDVDSRLVQHLLDMPVNDGGQYSMFVNIIKKYGLVPKSIYSDAAFSTTASAKLNALITTKLREFAQVLREKIAKGEDISDIRAEQQQEIFKIMTIFLGYPPVRPDEEFAWEFTDKDKKFYSIKTTPLKFVKDILKFDPSKPVSLINDPRHPYNQLIKIDRLGNVLGGDEVVYLNLDNDKLSQLVVDRIKKNRPVFFGSHTPKFMDKKRGVMDTDLWNYEAIGYQINQDKEFRIRYHETLMTHAMLITGVHVDENNKPIRYRVENSWSKDSGKDGYYSMTQKYFEEYCFQIVVDDDELAPEDAKIFQEGTPITLPLWDPMGALAQ